MLLVRKARRPHGHGREGQVKMPRHAGEVRDHNIRLYGGRLSFYSDLPRDAIALGEADFSVRRCPVSWSVGQISSSVSFSEVGGTTVLRSHGELTFVAWTPRRLAPVVLGHQPTLPVFGSTSA